MQIELLTVAAILRIHVHIVRNVSIKESSSEQGPIRYTVPELLGLSSEHETWIVDQLLKRGTQMILAGAPKSGKSLLASEFALMLATPFGKKEKRVLFSAATPVADRSNGFVINRPDGKDAYTVLFVSLEMRAPEVGARLGKQIAGLKLVGRKDPKAFDKIKLEHVFGLPREDGEESELQIIHSHWVGDRKAVGTSSDYQALRKLIQEVAPDLVIYDTLVQMHREDENDNVMMNGLLKTLRRMTSKDVRGDDNQMRPEPIAHIILHHTRKLGAAARGGRITADDMRGAGAFHGAADIVLMVKPNAREPSLIEAEVSARSTSVPAFVLKRGPNLTHSCLNSSQEPEGKVAVRQRLLTDTLLRIIEKNRKLNPRKTADQIAKAYGSAFPRPSEGSIERRITSLAQSGLIAVEKKVRSSEEKTRAMKAFKWDCLVTLLPRGKNILLKNKKNPKP